MAASTRTPARLLQATTATEQHTGGEGSLCPGKKGGVTDSPPKGCFFLSSLAVITWTNSSSDHLDKQQLCWHNAQPWQQPHKPFCSAGEAFLHTSFYMHLNTTRVLMQTCALAAVTVPQGSEAVSQLWRSLTQTLNLCQAHHQLITPSAGTTSHCQALTGSEMEGDSEPPKLVVGRKKPSDNHFKQITVCTLIFCSFCMDAPLGNQHVHIPQNKHS